MLEKIFIVGNPNTGKSCLFNSLTKSEEHVGNWHGVTVKEKSKIVNYKGQDYQFFDLPGLYSLSPYSFEEEVSAKLIKENSDAKIFYLMDANCFERNLFLLLELLEEDRNIKVLINNYEDFKKRGGNLDVDKLKNFLNCDIEIINAKKIKLNKNVLKFNKINKNNSLNNKNLNIEDKYKKIQEICKICLKYNKNNIYGYSIIDNYLLQSYIFLPLFFIFVFFSLFVIFFLIGPKLNDGLSFLLNLIIRSPIVYFFQSVSVPIFVKRIFEEAIFSSLLSISAFLPQVCLLYLFLNILEESGLISRLSFMLDDFLTKVGLNGKVVYTLLMGFGCNTTATFSSKNMADKNTKIKTALITPFMSCTAKLPVYSVVASALFGVKSIWIIILLYIIGILVAIIIASILNKTILKSGEDDFLIEFPPLRFPKVKDCLKESLKTSKQFVSKLFGIIFSMSVIIWLLSNISFSFRLTSIENSILYFLSSKISPIFKPLGLDSPYIVCALLVGLVAKELIVSSMLIFNKVTSSAFLMLSLSIATSPLHFTKASALSFLIFVLLYAPCVSNIAVMFKEVGKKYALFGVFIEFLTAYLISMFAYNLLIGEFLTVFLTSLSIFVVLVAFVYIFKHFKASKCKGTCINCNKCG